MFGCCLEPHSLRLRVIMARVRPVFWMLFIYLKANAGQFGFEEVSALSKDLEAASESSKPELVLQKAQNLLFELHKLNDK